MVSQFKDFILLLENKQGFTGPLLLILLCITAWFFEPCSGEWLAYDRFAVQGLETWRLLSANIVHTNGNHLLLNVAALLLLMFLHSEHYRILRFFKLFVWCALFTSIGIYCFSTDMIWYAGLSGALHGVFVWGALMDLRAGYKSGWVLLAGVVMKILYEQQFGGSADMAALIDASVAVDAHLYGGLAGFTFYVLLVIPGLSALIQKNKNIH